MVPEDLRRALEDAGLSAAFSGLSPSHQREYLAWIEEARKPETRTRRISQTVDRLQELR